MNIKSRLSALRALMKKHGVQAYVIPSSDEHADEYVPGWWRRREWVSGFTGSAGELVVSLKSAALWTDGRYFLQAERQLHGSGITLMKLGQPGTPKLADWTAAQCGKHGKAGTDPAVCTMSTYARLRSGLDERGCKLISVSPNLIDQLWKDKPLDPASLLQVHPERYAGVSVATKFGQLRAAMKAASATAHVISALDSIAWLLNLRGTDVECNPFFISFLIVREKNATLYVDLRKVTPDARKAMSKLVEIRAYSDAPKGLKELATKHAAVLLDPAATNQSVANQLAKGCAIVEQDSPVVALKAAKNPAELRGMRDCHIRDGAAVARFFSWLDANLGKTKITEISAGEKLESCRAMDSRYRGPSFDTIAGYGPNGAIVHYRAEPATNLTLKRKGLFLLDSGGQYLDGTTDITRTVALSAPTVEQKAAFTCVFKGMLGLLLTKFPAGTNDRYLDIVARSQLWAGGFDYNHGTGHGVGCYLGVHEGPQRFNPFRDTSAVLVPGMIISNEPGYYKAGEYGIRTEFLMYITEDKALSNPERKMLKFEPLTMCPIDTRLIDKSLLTPFETKWLNRYHAAVKKALRPYLNAKERKWLERATKKI
ncbi:aminopeptidase P family protein [candidate division KSB1 bacterium]|nr:aminopeptidase P family protein [candidate division KSB1 bacterium]